MAQTVKAGHPGARSPRRPAGAGGAVGRCRDDELVALLRARDETAYDELVRRYTPLMLRLARSHLPDRACAEEVVQETWLAVVTGIDGFEGRATLRTWLLRILMNTARGRGRLESRSVPLSSVPGDAGPWERLLPPTPDLPARDVLQRETLVELRAVLRALPERQAAVFVMRHLEGRTADEVCVRLGVTADNQRVLLHRARTRLRAAVATPGRTAGRPPGATGRVTGGPRVRG